MRLPSASMKSTFALILAACSTTGCSLSGALDLSAPVLPDTVVAILALLAGIFAVAWSRYARRGETSEGGANGRGDNLA